MHVAECAPHFLTTGLRWAASGRDELWYVPRGTRRIVWVAKINFEAGHKHQGKCALVLHGWETSLSSDRQGQFQGQATGQQGLWFQNRERSYVVSHGRWGWEGDEKAEALWKLECKG